MAERPDDTVAGRRRAPGVASRLRRRCSGVILIMTLLAIGVIIALVFLVYNAGNFINARLRMQNIADSVAISGAGWSARSMNVIAMNNCGQSRMLALVPVLDSMPLATEMALSEVTAWEAGLSGQVPNVPSSKDDYLRKAVSNLRDRMASERDILIGLDQVFNKDFDMRSVTYWQYEGGAGSAPHGSLWRTAQALEEFSYVTWQTSDLLAQASAVRFGEANGADVAMLLPLTPKVPAKVGEYKDFQPVLVGESRVYGKAGAMKRTGRLGGGIPDFVYPHRLGPWGTLYLWRRNLVIYSPTDPPPPPPPPDDRPPPPIKRTRGRTGTYAPGGRRRAAVPTDRRDEPEIAESGHESIVENILATWEGDVPLLSCAAMTGGSGIVMGWYTWGPFEWARNKAFDGATYQFSLSLYPSYIKNLANAKVTYLFDTPEELKTIHFPEWIHMTDYPGAVSLAESEPEKIAKTLYYRVHVRSSIPPTSANYLSEGTYVGNIEMPVSVWMNGWRDAATWPYYEQVANYMWRDRFEYETTYDPDIGIVNTWQEGDEEDDEPELEYHPVYVDVHYIWGGVDIGEEVEIANPCNWSEGTVLPRPLLFDPGPNGELEYRYDPDDYTKLPGYGFLGIAREKKYEADVWPRRFTGLGSIEGMLTIAQAKLFNNLSWDLWTQDWQVQLAPVVKWDDWLWELEQAQWELDQVNGLVDYKELREIDKYLRSIDEDMMRAFLSH